MKSALDKIVLFYPTPDGTKEFVLTNRKLSIGRGETVDLRLADNSLSRHHATIYCDHDRVWIIDENSTNGSFVNNVKVAPQGAVLKNNDSIRLGNETTLTVVFSPRAVEQPVSARRNTNFSSAHLPLIAIGIAVFVIGLAAIVVGMRAISFEPSVANQIETREEQTEDAESQNENSRNSGSQNKNAAVRTVDANALNSNLKRETNENTNLAQNVRTNQIIIPPPKLYAQMSESEKRLFIERESEQIARMIGNRSGEAVTPEAVERIKIFVDGYAKRLKTPKTEGVCNMRGDLPTVLERASKNAPFIVPAFNAEGIAPQIGIYLAMIESEHCVCLQSPTGPLGMFQFARATATSFGLDARAGASPANPDDRCVPEKAAPAAARYMKFLAGRFGTGPLSVPLAIASYNSGEGGLSTNLSTALAEEAARERSFWTLVANEGKLSAQFQKENVKYVPKFFAAAIVGENPTVFGVNLQPISSNTK